LKTITQRYKFDFAHHLPGYNGLCQRAHGHTGILEVTLREHKCLRRFWEKYPGMIIDWNIMKGLIAERVLIHIDHNDLNTLMDIPTAENLLDWVIDRLKDDFGEALEVVRIYESDKAWVTWKRE
jgi:6-pyruvoyltetrahydropterin/6-carboxytetrahydropterin synthase